MRFSLKHLFMKTIYAFIIALFFLPHQIFSQHQSQRGIEVGVCDTLQVNFSDSSIGLTENFTDLTITGPLVITKHLWTFGDTASHSLDTSMAQSPTHVYPNYGFYTVCLAVEATYFIDSAHNGHCADSMCRTIEVLNTHVAIKETPADDFHIYPNPTEGSFIIKTAIPLQRLQITDLTGKVLLSEGYSSEVIDLPPQIKNGTYLLQVFSEREVLIKKITVLR